MSGAAFLVGASSLVGLTDGLILLQALYSGCRIFLIDSHFLSLGIDLVSAGIAWVKLKDEPGLGAALFGPSFNFAQDERWSGLQIRNQREYTPGRWGVAQVLRRNLSGA